MILNDFESSNGNWFSIFIFFFSTILRSTVFMAFLLQVVCTALFCQRFGDDTFTTDYKFNAQFNSSSITMGAAPTEDVTTRYFWCRFKLLTIENSERTSLGALIEWVFLIISVPIYIVTDWNRCRRCQAFQAFEDSTLSHNSFHLNFYGSKTIIIINKHVLVCADTHICRIFGTFVPC